MEEDNVGVTSLDLVVGKLLARCAEKLNEESHIYNGYDSIPQLKYAGNPPSGKESRRTRRMLELRRKKGRL